MNSDELNMINSFYNKTEDFKNPAYELSKVTITF